MLEGHCLCGQFSYSCSADPLTTIVCHCKSCQRQSGTAYSISVAVPKDSVTTRGNLKSFVDQADSGATVERQFCPECGSPIFSMPSSIPNVAIIKAGTLNDSSRLKPDSEVWCDSAQAWLKPILDAPRFPKNPTFKTTNPIKEL